MRFTLSLLAVAACLSPAAGFAQNSQQWQQFGEALGNAIINNGNPPSRPQGNQPPQKPRQYQYQAPNTSGQANIGGFNDGGDFFGGQNGGVVRPQPQQGGVYNPGSQVYRPQYQPQSQYQNGLQPQYSNGGSTYHEPYARNIQDPPAAPRAAYSNLPILIECPEGVEGACHYELVNPAGKAYPYDISAGLKQTFPESTEWQIRYEPVHGRGYKTYRLRGGKNYSLQRDAQGQWQLYMAS